MRQTRVDEVKKTFEEQDIQFVHIQKWMEMEKKEVDEKLEKYGISQDGIRMTILSVLGH